MKIYYSAQYNFDLGMASKLADWYRFDYAKFRHTKELLADLSAIEYVAPAQALSLDVLQEPMMLQGRAKSRSKTWITRALGLPNLPFLSLSWLDQHFLLPMRWACAATLQAASAALQGESAWNTSGGYHHASSTSCEGFCIYNDISTAVFSLRADGKLSENDRILIIDVDACHGNGIAYDFFEDERVTILDLYNDGIYPIDRYSKKRIDIALPLPSGSEGPAYLSLLESGLAQLRARIAAHGAFKLAFVIAGANVLASDRYARLALEVQDCAERDWRIHAMLKQAQIPAVFLGGGGYGPEAAQAQAASIRRLLTPAAH
ncbi:hypothetical protein V8J88_08210 [Massilia sp. W12]|uniref:hypothetical protein n=1 Tax=Massilia sp. W12 TaxID=3126507 RepID=UPI0030D3F777